MTQTLRDKYFANEILCIGDIVEDSVTGESMKIIDRGSNYITLATKTGTTKKWLNEVTTNKEKTTMNKKEDFTLLESGQIGLFGYETKHFDMDLSILVLEQFEEFDDMYSKHQIVKLIDSIIQEANLERKAKMIEKVNEFYHKHDIAPPILIEGIKSELERTQIANIFATVADVKAKSNPYQTISDALIALKKKYTRKDQWEILLPFLKVAYQSGIMGINKYIPFGLSLSENSDDVISDSDAELQESFIMESKNDVSELVNQVTPDDIYEAFDISELYDLLSESQLNEYLSIASRASLSRKMSQHQSQLATKKERALRTTASTTVLQARARKLAEAMLKRLMFHKAVADMSRQEKEQFEAGAARRKATVAKLAMKLLAKVRMLQTNRLHSQNSEQEIASHDNKDIGVS